MGGAPKERRKRCRETRPKWCFWRVRFFSAPLRFVLKTPENIRGKRNRFSKNTLLDDRFSLHDAFSAPLSRSVLSGTESRIANRTMPGNRGPGIARISAMRKLSTKMSRIAIKYSSRIAEIGSELPIRIATPHCLKL